MEAVEEEAEEDEAREDEADEEDAEEEDVNGNAEHAGETVTIRVKDLTGEETMFKIKKSTKFVKIMNAYAMRKGVEAMSLRFLLDCERIHPDDTCATLQLEDGDQVYVMLEQSGC